MPRHTVTWTTLTVMPILAMQCVPWFYGCVWANDVASVPHISRMLVRFPEPCPVAVPGVCVPAITCSHCVQSLQVPLPADTQRHSTASSGVACHLSHDVARARRTWVQVRQACS